MTILPAAWTPHVITVPLGQCRMAFSIRFAKVWVSSSLSPVTQADPSTSPPQFLARILRHFRIYFADISKECCQIDRGRTYSAGHPPRSGRCAAERKSVVDGFALSDGGGKLVLYRRRGRRVPCSLFDVNAQLFSGVRSSWAMSALT